MVMEPTGMAFPRGGRGRPADDESPDKSQRKRKTSSKSVSASNDFLFGSGDASKGSEASRSKRSKTTTSSSSSHSSSVQSLLPLGGGGVVVVSKKAKRKSKGSADGGLFATDPLIEALGFSKLSKGTKVLGCLKEVQDEFAVVSLPNLLTGYILLGSSTTAGVNSLKQCLRPGQVLGVVVQKVVTESFAGGVQKKRIQVSALPSHVNPTTAFSGPSAGTVRGQILSVEDHGCLVDLGFGRQGFLKFDDIEGGKYTILEDDEEEDLNDDDEKKPRRLAETKPNRILQTGRLYDFLPRDDSASSGGKASVLPLKLPSPATLAQRLTLPVAAPSSRSKQPQPQQHTLGSLQPGMMVTAKVEAHARNGLCVAFLGNVFRGAIELGSHLGGHFANSEAPSATTIGSKTGVPAWRKVFDRHQHFPARIIAIDVPTKLIRLSIAPHILSLRRQGPPSVPTESDSSSAVGATVDACTVVRLDPGIGALLALPHSDDEDDATGLLPKSIRNKSDLFQNTAFVRAMSVPAVYVHISKAFDPEEQDSKHKKGKSKSLSSAQREAQNGRFAKEFAVGTSHSVRILSTGHWMDKVAAGGCAPSLLEAHVLTHADLKPGQVFQQVPVCAQLSGGSILINLGGGGTSAPVRGLIPSPMHLIDNNNKSSEFRKKVLATKFAVDAKVDVRVLWVDHATKKCVVTAKKSLVKVADDSQVVTSYDQLHLGQKVVGFVSKVDDRALYVTFCNRVYGKVTAKSLAAELGIEDHREAYQVGDVVNCRVVKINKSSPRHKSLDDDDDDVDMQDMDEENAEQSQAYYQITLSLNVQEEGMDEDDTEKSRVDSSKPAQIHVQAGAILPAKSMKIVELVKGKKRTRGGGFVPGYAIVTVKSKYLLDKSEHDLMLSEMECKLPFDQLLDEYNPEDIEQVQDLDSMAAQVLRVGKKINQKAIVLTDPKKSNVDHSSGIGRLTVVSLRKKLIETMEKQASLDKMGPKDIHLPNQSSPLFVGALVMGFVAQVDQRHGAFLRFLDGMTGLIPRVNGGLELTPHSTIVAKVQVIDDTVKPFRIMLQPITGKGKDMGELPFKVGEKISKAKITAVNIMQATLQVPGSDFNGKLEIVIHSSMKEAPFVTIKAQKKVPKKGKISKGHPFYGMKKGDLLSDLTVVCLSRQKGKAIVHVTDREPIKSDGIAPPVFVQESLELKAGMTTSAVVTDILKGNKGLHVAVSPLVKGFIPGLELSSDIKILNDLKSHISLGCRLECVVMDRSQWHENRAKCPFASSKQKSWLEDSAEKSDSSLFLSILAVREPTLAVEKPARNDMVVGQITKALPQIHAPSLMLSLRGGFVGQSCITELAETDEWENLPMGRTQKATFSDKQEKDEAGDSMDVDSDDSDSESSGEEDSQAEDEESSLPFPDGKYVECRVLRALPRQSVVEVSLRESRIEGDLEDDEPPPEGETVQGYVIQTNPKGCFVRLARHVEGRVTLKELCDGFLPNPTASFPAGRLVVGKVKKVQPAKKKGKNSTDPTKYRLDLDMRESTLLENQKNLLFEDVEVQGKYKGTVTRVESYGVFVRLENSKLSGLTHMSECSDGFIKNLGALYDPGDLVKVLVIKKDEESKKLGFSMKASHFEDDEDSDDDSSVEDEDTGLENIMSDDDQAELDSDDENFASKLAAKMEAEDGSSDDEDGSGSEDEDDSDSDSESDDDQDSDDDEESVESTKEMDTNVGFDWDNWGETPSKKKPSEDDDNSDESEEDEDEDGGGTKASRKSKKKLAQRRKEEKEISERELALADGTADENPETAGDFERLLAGSPNSSELWIRYMAFHLSLADIAAARRVAERAIERIEFREETEKLNVWTALLTLEKKYGSPESFRKTIDRACNQNNPKKVYLRACEILESDLSSPENVSEADAMHQKACKKFKSKKTVWLAHAGYLVKQGRSQEAHALLKKALLSLKPYKHAEAMSRFAQLEYEFGSPERARTLFDGVLAKHPKRLDLLFVYADKEVKFGSPSAASALLEARSKTSKLSDNQMKSLFKKWFRLEQQHGTEESMERVKDAAREHVRSRNEES